MSQVNPYEQFLAGQEPVAVLAETAGKIESILNVLGPEQANLPRAPGKWSAREIVCHLADCEIVFAFRLRQTLAEERHVIQPFDQDKWADSYAAYAAPEALATFAAVRKWNLTLLRSFNPEACAKQVIHPERGTMTFRTIVETMAGHDINHLRQLEAIAKSVASAR